MNITSIINQPNGIKSKKFRNITHLEGWDNTVFNEYRIRFICDGNVYMTQINLPEFQLMIKKEFDAIHDEDYSVKKWTALKNCISKVIDTNELECYELEYFKKTFFDIMHNFKNCQCDC